MEAKDMKKFTISNLVLIVLSDKYPDSLRKYAEIELRRRFRNVAWDINDFIDKENKKIEKRGLDINNYLFSKNLDMQKLMEVYFLYYYGYSQNEDDLLFSEKHICGMSSSVFREILKNEIANLEARIIIDNDKNNLKLLEIFKLALEKELIYIEKIDKEKENTAFFKRIELDEAFQYLNEDKLLSLGFNISDEEIYKIFSSKLLMLKRFIMEEFSDSILEMDFFQNIYGMKKVLEDSRRLEVQKNNLLKQAEGTFPVDYESDVMRLVYPRLGNNANRHIN